MPNIAASNFFYFNNQLMYESMMLHLSRLTDPPKTRSQENLTLESLLDVLDDTEAVLKSKLQTTLDRVRDACKLQSVTAKDLENPINAIRDFIGSSATAMFQELTARLAHPFPEESVGMAV